MNFPKSLRCHVLTQNGTDRWEDPGQAQRCKSRQNSCLLDKATFSFCRFPGRPWGTRDLRPEHQGTNDSEMQEHVWTSPSCDPGAQEPHAEQEARWDWT